MQSALTGVGTVVGTPAYMSPEQCRGEPIDARSDIYACGVLLYQLVSGKLPFSSQNAMDVAVMHVRQPPTPLEELVPAVDRRLSALVLKALAKWPSQRQQTAAELRDALRALLPELSATPLEPAPAPALPAAAPAPPAAAPAPAPMPAEAPKPVQSSSKDRPTLPETLPDTPSPLKGLDTAAAPGGDLAVTLDSAAPTLDLDPERVAAAKAAAEAKRAPAPIQVRAAAPVSRRSAGRMSTWLIVPLALVLGIAVGALAFFLTRR
jgi:serine/threonine-protein kinase